MGQDAQHILVLESIAEVMARLLLLEETQARLEAAAEHQLELLEGFTTRQEQLLILMTTGMEHAPMPSSARQSQANPVQNNSENRSAQANQFTDQDHEYSRETHPALFKVIDLLESDEKTRQLSVRQLAQTTGVSKS